MHCLDLVQVQRYAPARSDIRDVAVCNSGGIEVHVDIGRSNYADPAESGQCAASRSANARTSTPDETGIMPIVTGREARP